MSGTLYLVARIAGHAIAIESDQVQSVVDLGPIVPVPRAARHVRGLVALRSKVVTVIDTRSVLGMAPSGCEVRRAVIVVVDGHPYAMLVDGLDDVAPFDPVPLSDGIVLSPEWAVAVRGLIERAGEPVLILDLTALVPGGGAALAA